MMERVDLPLLLHGEVTDTEIDIFDRERVFLERHLAPLHRDFPGLRIVLEHVTTKDSVDFVRGARFRVTTPVQHFSEAEERGVPPPAEVGGENNEDADAARLARRLAVMEAANKKLREGAPPPPVRNVRNVRNARNVRNVRNARNVRIVRNLSY